MQFIRLVKTIDIAERVLPELVADCADTKSMQRINIIVVLHLWEHMVVSWVIEWLNSALLFCISENIWWYLELLSGWTVHCPISAPLGIPHIGYEPYATCITMTCSGQSPTQAANRDQHCHGNPSAWSQFKLGPVLLTCLSWVSTGPTALCHASSMLMAPFMRDGISLTRSCALFSVSGGYLFQYYKSWVTAAKPAKRRKNWSSEFCQMHKWLAQMSLQQEVEPVYPTTNRLCSTRSTFDDPLSQRGALVHNPGVSEMGDVLGGTENIWKYRCCIIFWRYWSQLQSNHYHRAQNRVPRRVFTEHQLIGMIRFWSWSIHLFFAG